MWIPTVLLFAFIIDTSFAALPDGFVNFITPCKQDDRKCLISSAEKAAAVLANGVPELDVKQLDPMFIEYIQSKRPSLVFELKNTTVSGLKNCKLSDLTRQGYKMSIEVICNLVLEGDYKLNGKLLVFEITGKGKSEIKLFKLKVKIDYEVSEKQKDDETYWNVSSWKYDTDVLDHVEYRFQNFFNGNTILADAVQIFINTSWREVYQEVAPPIVDSIVKKIVAEVRKLFDQVPAKFLALD